MCVYVRIYVLTYVISPLLPVRQKLTVTDLKQSHTYLFLELSLAATEYQFVLNILAPRCCKLHHFIQFQQ